MNAKLKGIFDRAETWPEWAQEQLAEVLLSFEQELVEPHELSAEDKKAIDRSLDDMRHGRFVSDAEIATLFDRSRPK